VLIGIVASILLLLRIFRASAEEKEYKRKLKESLEDEFIIDPETGAKLTLEEAESGHWIDHNNEYRPVPEIEIKKLYSKEDKDAERALNYLKKSNDYKKHDLSEKDVQLLESSKILGQYDKWLYSNVFHIEYCDGTVFLPEVYLLSYSGSYSPEKSYDYNESQILFWIRLDTDFGHYYLREKTGAEAFFDSIKVDDDLILANYESFTVKKTMNMLRLQHLVTKFEGQPKLEIEFMGNNLFVKNLKYINTKDLMRIEKVIKDCLNI
jgi:hypothetical protein